MELERSVICVGIDPSSGITGVCLIYGDEIIWHDAYKTDPKLPIEKNMMFFGGWLSQQLSSLIDPTTIDVCVVEKVSVSWNVNTIRKIAYYEAVAMLWASYKGIRVFQPQATKARRIVFDKGNMSKEACFARVKEDWPDEDWATMDEADAMILAMAGPGLVEEG